jgi:predicted enzyme related to lactoylglutathione lyase
MTTTATDQQPAATAKSSPTVGWWELQVTDLASAQAFYGAVFGWEFEAFGDTFAIIKGADGSMLGGIDQREGDPAGRAVRVYISVDDLESTLAAVRDAGGTVVQERTMVSEEYGWWAQFEDPSGLPVALHTNNAAAL